MSARIGFDEVVLLAGERSREQAARFRQEMRTAGLRPTALRERAAWLALALVEDAMGVTHGNQRWVRQHGSVEEQERAGEFYLLWGDVDGQLGRWTAEMVDGLCERVLMVPQMAHA